MSILDSQPVIVERAFSAAQVETLRAAVDASKHLMLTTLRRANSVGFETLMEADLMAPVMSALSVFQNSEAHSHALSHFPNGYCFLLRNCSFRRHDPSMTQSRLNLHFDANFVGLEAKAVNVWVTLDDIGNGVPGLTFLGSDADPTVLYRQWRAAYDKHLAGAGLGGSANVFFDANYVRRLYSTLGEAAFVSPRVRAGDFIAFHQLVPHATEEVPGQPLPRSSIEFRIAAIDALPHVYRHKDLWVAVQKTDERGVRDVRIMRTFQLAAELGVPRGGGPDVRADAQPVWY